MRYREILFLSALLIPTVYRPALAQQNGSAERWESAIQEFEAADRATPYPQGGVVFVGSSSIRFWDSLAEDFPGLNPLNRGFGGSRISDVRYFLDRLVLKHRPRQVVIYAGDNDLAAGRTPQQIFDDYRAIVERIHEELPRTRVAFISIKPSPSRWEMAAEMREANAMVSRFSAQDPLLDYIDVFTPMLNANGEPRDELFRDDDLHMNADGYALWRSIVAPYVTNGEEAMRPAA